MRASRASQASWSFGRIQEGYALMGKAVEADPDPERLLVYADCFRRSDQLEDAEKARVLVCPAKVRWIIADSCGAVTPPATPCSARANRST